MLPRCSSRSSSATDSYWRRKRWRTAQHTKFLTGPTCDRVLPVLGPQNDIVAHRQALPHRDVAAAIETVRAGSAQPAAKLAFEFLVLTAARSGEVRGTQWAEIDTTGRVWTLSALRMKAKREHRVPLCRRALEVLDVARALGDGNPLVFPMRSGRPISASTLL